jgi:vitamin B12 transporter
MKSILFALSFIPALAFAQAPDTTTLNPVVISATKTPSTRESLTQSVTVLTGEQLRAKGITRVSDALRLVPGAALVQNGSLGSVNTLFLRGGESHYTKVLIDGVSVNAPGGFFDFSHLTTDNIERIEVVRGPASVVYGADAVTGIVRIFTRQGRGPLSVNAEARAGKYDTREANVEANGASRMLRYSVGGGVHRTDGILPFNNQYYNGTVSGSLGMTPQSGTDANLTARYTTAEFHYPTDYTGAPVDSNSYRVQHRLTLGMDAERQLAKETKARLSLGTNQVSDLSEDITQPFGVSARGKSSDFSRERRHSAEGSLVFALPENSTLSVGGEYVAESERSRSSFGPITGTLEPISRFNAKRHNTALFTELLSKSRSGGSLTLAARRDDNSDYDAFTTYRAGISLPAGVRSRVRASISTAFNAPAFNELRATLYTVASPDLRPEKARSWEVGAEQTLADGILRLSADYFSQRFTDLIQYVNGGPPNFLGSYANLAEAKSNGYEVEANLTPGSPWSATASYTFAKPQVTETDASYVGSLKAGDAPVRRPRKSAAGSISWSRAHTGTFSVIANYVGERPDYDFNQFPSPVVTLPAYTKVDLAASRNLLSSSVGRSLSVTIRVDNLLDKKYEDVLHYPAPRRSYLIGARLSGAM